MGKTFNKVMMYMSPLYLITSLLMKGNRKKMKRGDITKIEATQAEEGSVIPMCYGTTRVAGNIVYYGNLREKVKNGQSASKGSGEQQEADQVETILDVHMVLAKGLYTLNEIYLNDEPYEPNASVLVNPTTLNYSADCGTFSGLTHVFFQNWNIGQTSQVPNLQFSLTRDVSHVPSWAKPSIPTGYGTNPATIIYDVLHECGVPDADLHQQSFSDASTLWNNRGWELNWIFAEQKTLDECIKDIFTQVPGHLYKDGTGLIYLKGFDTGEVATLSVDPLDVKDLTVERQSMDTVATDFIANYLDSKFVDRTCHISNEVVSNQVGKISKTLDYKGFREENIQSRVNLDLRMGSYPTLKLRMKLPILYADSVFPGTLFTFACPQINLPSRTYHVSSIKKSSNELAVEVEAEEFPDSLLDGYQIDDSGHQEIEYKIAPAELDYVNAVPYPKTKTYPNNSILLLFAQKTGQERTVDLHGEYNGSGVYSFLGNFNGWSEHGVLVGAYDKGHDLDDTIGFYIDVDAKFDTSNLANITRYELFTTNRVAVIGNEIVKFQGATMVTPTRYHITGILRATTQLDHIDGEHIFIGHIGGNVLENVASEASLSLKFLPKTKWETLADATPITISYQINPYPVVRIEANRTGSSVAVSIIPNTQNPASGWGTEDETLYIDYNQPYPILGQLLYSTDNVVYTATTTSQITITDANSFTFYVKHLYNGRESLVKSVFVDTADGTYIGG